MRATSGYNDHADHARQRRERLRQLARSARVDLIEVWTDGGHLDAANTKAIGTALVPVVKRILDL